MLNIKIIEFAFFTDPIIQFILGGGGVFVLTQWIISSLKHDTVPRVNNLYCFYVKNIPKRVALWDRENSQLISKFTKIICIFPSLPVLESSPIQFVYDFSITTTSLCGIQ